MIPEQAAWLILFLPIAGFTLISFVIRPLIGADSRLAGYTAIASIGAAFALSVWALRSTLGHHGEAVRLRAARVVRRRRPSAAQDGFQMTVGILLDPLSAIMAGRSSPASAWSCRCSPSATCGRTSTTRTASGATTPAISRLHVAVHRLHAGAGDWRTTSSSCSCSGSWSGSSSYLLIGFWYHRPAAAAAAKKAFIVTRIGDFGFMLGHPLSVPEPRGPSRRLRLNPFEIPAILEAAPMLVRRHRDVGGARASSQARSGKSAQFPLHTWLPDAMEGPTPVSARSSTRPRWSPRACSSSRGCSGCSRPRARRR